MNTVVVYHGSTSSIEKIDVTMGKPYKDFGLGFYVTKSKSHATNLALRNKRIEIERFGRPCEAYLHTYEIDMSKLAGFNVKEFPDADLEWVKFVLANRKVRERAHNYDVVIGPTADDDTSIVLKAYFGGFYGDIGSSKAIETALTLIEADKLPPQIYFASNHAVKSLMQKGQAVML